MGGGLFRGVVAERTLLYEIPGGCVCDDKTLNQFYSEQKHTHTRRAAPAAPHVQFPLPHLALFYRNGTISSKSNRVRSMCVYVSAPFLFSPKLHRVFMCVCVCAAAATTTAN